MGPQWATIADSEGQRRLDDPDDTVRLEIEAALARNIRVIPVLVDNTVVPRRQQLPESLVPLARRNALELSYNRYAYDLGRLLEAIEKLVGQPTPPSAAPVPATVSSRPGIAPATSAAARPPARAAGEDIAQLIGRADAARLDGRYQEALRDLDRSLQVEPDNAFALGQRKLLR